MIIVSITSCKVECAKTYTREFSRRPSVSEQVTRDAAHGTYFVRCITFSSNPDHYYCRVNDRFGRIWTNLSLLWWISEETKFYHHKYILCYICLSDVLLVNRWKEMICMTGWHIAHILMYHMWLFVCCDYINLFVNVRVCMNVWMCTGKERSREKVWENFYWHI